MKNLNHYLVSLLCALFALAACSGSGGGEPDPGNPVLLLEVVAWGGESVTLKASTLEATHVRAVCRRADDAAPAAADVYAKGTSYTGPSFTVGGLEPMTEYTLYAVACNDAGAYGSVQSVAFRTEYSDPHPYDWESSRSGILSYTDMVLCYGGSTHRTPYRWSVDRFAPMVSYTDPGGREHWLFDAFLCIEFRMGDYSINLGQHLDSGTREHWEELLDYWLSDPETGVGALEKAVAAAAQRLGTPPSKRKVVMVMPDPIIYEYYDGTKPSTTYWGEVNGCKMDFAKDQDRITAQKWYINEVRRHFDEAGYRYIELAGFYIVSEDLATPGDGWNPELKRWENVVPYVADYLHALNQSVAWIPYNRASGYANWQQKNIDYAYMQPNRFWGEGLDTKTWTRFFSDIEAHDLGMEIEFDEDVLEIHNSGFAPYRTRLREYMSQARDNGTYGTKPFAYYQGQDAFYEMAKSSAAGDRELFDELCLFVLDNPLRAAGGE